MTTIDATEGHGVEFQVGETAETGAVEQGAENQPSEQHINQEAVNKAIGRQHAKFQEEKKRADQLAEEKRQLEEKLAGYQQTSAPVIPPMPDPYDEDFNQKVAARDKAIFDKARYDNEQAQLRSQQEDNQRQSQEQAQAAQQEVVKNFNARTAELGLEPQEMESAAQTVISYGVDGNLANFILKDADGPLILKHLAQNPVALNELASMDAMSAAVKVSTTIRAEAQKLKPQQSQTPDPPLTLGGNGVAEQLSPLIAGATFT